MVWKQFSCKLVFGVLFFSVFSLFFISPTLAYNYGVWTYDGYLKSQFGVFTQGKPFNESDFGGSNDNMATARQQVRFNLNGQATSNLAIRAELLAAWEPDYPHDKGIGAYGHDAGYIVGEPGANYYSSLDWRELTLEYKPKYEHTIRFGRQIINWGEAISGRVVDQCNPVDSRYLLGFTNLEETYMPLWMFRGMHDFTNQNFNFEWIAAPIWQADRYEHSRRVTNAGGRSGDGIHYGGPWYRFGANPEGRVFKYGGADMALAASPSFSGRLARIYGPPFATGYHGTDLLPGWKVGDPVLPLDPTNPTHMAFINAYAPASERAALGAANIIWTEFPSTDGLVDPNYGYNYTDHNFKNTRWGFKTKYIVSGAEMGVSFYQGPDQVGYYRYKYRMPASGAVGRLIYEYEVPRYNTFGIFGNFQSNFGVFVFEGAYKPDRWFHKNLFGLPPGIGANAAWVHEARLRNIAEKDVLHTLLGVTREQSIPLLNKYNVFTVRAQWQALYYLEDMDDVTEVTTYFMTPPRLDNEFMVMISTAYAYRKYNPSLTIVTNPRGQVYSSLGFNWVVDGFNDRLNVSVGYTDIWGANDYSTPTVLAAKNDLAVVTVQYSFY
jgi:hypothetical protein